MVCVERDLGVGQVAPEEGVVGKDDGKGVKRDDGVQEAFNTMLYVEENEAGELVDMMPLG